MATYQESSSGTLPFYNDAFQQLLNKGQAQAGAAYTPYTGQQVAGFNPQQQQAFGLATQNVGNYQPLLNQAAQFTNQSVQSAQYDPSQMAQFMNPYTSGVVDEIGRLGAEQFQNQIAPGIASSFGGLGQYGSARQGAVLSDAAARSQRETLGAQANALNTGYNQAANQYLNWGQLGTGAQQQAGSQLGNLAQAQQQLGIGDVGTLLTAGQTQQANQQLGLDKQYEQFQQQQQYPWQQLGNWAGLFGAGSTPTQSSSWNIQFKKGGLARFAAGGDFPRVSREAQKMRDEERLNLLLQELDKNPTDPDLISEIERMGVPRENLMFSDQSMAREPVVESAPVPAQIAAQSPRGGSSMSDLMRNAFDERVAMLQRARSAPELQPIEQGNMVGRIGEAMLRSSGKPMGHILQGIGTTGKEFFEMEDRRQDENQKRAIARLGLEEKIAPDPRSMRSGSSALENYVSVRGEDGKTYMVNRYDPSDRVAIGVGENVPKTREAAIKYADKQVEGGKFETTAQRNEAHKKYVEDYLTGRVDPRMAGVSGAQTGIAQGTKESTIIPTTEEEERDKLIGKGTGNRYTDILASADSASSQLANLNNLESLIEGVHTSKATPALTSAAGWLESFGIKLDPNLGAKEAFNAGTNQLSLQLRNVGEGAGMPGSLSDTDREFLVAMAPRLSNTQEGNKLLFDAMKKLARRQMEKGKFARDYKKNNPRGFDEGFEDAWDEYVNTHHLFGGKEEKKLDKALRTFNEIPDATEFEGKQMKAPDGTLYRSINGQWVKE